VSFLRFVESTVVLFAPLRRNLVMAEPSPAPTAPAPADLRMWNRKNPAIRRILADLKELSLSPSDQYAAKPTEENMFEWHFCIRGPRGTDYEGGQYHGKILLPSEYPFKPPNIVFLTPTGRWETRTKICLSMSAYHPELWQPAWGIRTILEALISFMPTPGDGAVGAVESCAEDRKRMARESNQYKHPLKPELPPIVTARPDEGSDGTAGSSTVKNPYAEQIAQLHFHSPAIQKSASSEQAEAVEEGQELDEATVAPQQQSLAGGDAIAMLTPESVADLALRLSSWAIGVAICILGYRKLLMVCVPDLLVV